MPIIPTTKQTQPREDNDNYPTPKDLIERVLDKFPLGPEIFEVLDPGAGDGAWGRVIKERYPWVRLTGVELRKLPKPPEYDDWIIGDFRTMRTKKRYDLAIGNPPYGKMGAVKVRGLAEQFVRHSLELLHDKGKLTFLLRLAFLEGQVRGDGLWIEHQPKAVAVCKARPSFSGNGKTDATAYGVFAWDKGWQGESTELTWL